MTFLSGGEGIYFYDTSALLHVGMRIFDEPFIISSVTLNELEEIKTSSQKDGGTKAAARRLLRGFAENAGEYFVKLATDEMHFNMLDKDLADTSDNLILECAASAGNTTPDMVFVTDDPAQLLIAKNVYHLTTARPPKSELETYKGYRSLTMDEDEMASFYCHLQEYAKGMRENEYLLISDKDGKVVDKYKRKNGLLAPIVYRQITNDYTGKIKPRNPLQECAFDMLQDASIPVKLIMGDMGTGKDYVMLAHALHAVLKMNKFQKIVWVRNTVEVRDSQQIGFLPGSIQDKLAPFAQIVSDHVGGADGLNVLITAQNIELQHLGYLRGRSIRNAIIYVSEAENLTVEHMQLLMARVDEGSALWLNGDLKQVDRSVFREYSGMARMAERLQGNAHFGCLRLEKVERGVVASMAKLLD